MMLRVAFETIQCHEVPREPYLPCSNSNTVISAGRRYGENGWRRDDRSWRRSGSDVRERRASAESSRNLCNHRDAHDENNRSYHKQRSGPMQLRCSGRARLAKVSGHQVIEHHVHVFHVTEVLTADHNRTVY